MAKAQTPAQFDAAHPDGTLREGPFTVGEKTYDTRVALSDELPPIAHITTAHCLAFDGDKILLVLHVFRGWTIPGGHLEAGETVEDAMRREALEEAGITVGTAKVLGFERIQIRGEPPPGYPYPNPGYQVFFVAPLVSLGAITALDEATEARLFAPHEARELKGWMVRNRGLYEAALRVATRPTG